MADQKNNNRNNKNNEGQQIEMGLQKHVRVKADENGRVTTTELADHEDRTLLPPVLLTPGWEDAHDDSSLDGPARTPPADKWNLVYIIMMLNGIGVLMPWNMFINANDYFVSFKLNSTADDGSAEYRKNFISYLGITAQIPNVVLNIVNMCAQCDMGNISRRIIISIMVMVLCFVVTIVFAILDSSDWPFEFFIITMVTVVVINMATGVYQNSVFGLAAIMPMKYTNAVVLGSNVSGTLTAIISLIATASSPNPRTAAIYYFLSAILILLIDFDTYFVLPLLKFFRFYDKRSREHQQLTDEDGDYKEVNCCPIKFLFGTIFKECWLQFLCVWLTFFVTLCCFPGLQVNIPSVDGNFIISNKYFQGVVCFLFFNAFAVIGNFTTEFIKKPGPKWLIVPVALRLVFIPFFFMCNYKPTLRTAPVYINSDWAYTVGSILHAYTHGYCSSLAMMYASKVAKPQYAGAAAMMAAFFLVLGIFVGVNATLLVSLLAEIKW